MAGTLDGLFPAEGGGYRVIGWYHDEENPTAREAIELCVDHRPFGLIIPWEFRQDLKDAGLGDGCCCFQYPIPDNLIDRHPHLISAYTKTTRQILSGFHVLPTADKNSSQSKTDIILVAIVKNEERYLVEWISFHQALGVNKFIIYDNESTDSTSSILGEFSRSGLVELVPWPTLDHFNTQTEAYNDALKRLPETCGWVGFMDLDEFLVGRNGASIKEILDLHQGASAVAFNWKLFGSSARQLYTPQSVTKRFLARGIDRLDEHRYFKTFARPEAIANVRVHEVILKRGFYCTAGGWPVHTFNGCQSDWPDYTIAQINHYFTKSQEEFDIKRLRGRADFPDGHPAKYRAEIEFFHHDRNEVSEHDVLAYSQSYKNKITINAKIGEAIAAFSPRDD